MGCCHSVTNLWSPSSTAPLWTTELSPSHGRNKRRDGALLQLLSSLPENIVILKVLTGQDGDEHWLPRYTSTYPRPFVLQEEDTVHTDNWRVGGGKRKCEAQRPAEGNKCLLCGIPTKTAAQTPDGFVRYIIGEVLFPGNSVENTWGIPFSPGFSRTRRHSV